MNLSAVRDGRGKAAAGSADRGHILVFDLGGSGLRGALVDGAGGFAASRTAHLSMPVAADGGTEADPETWWAALGGVAEGLAADAPAAFASVEAVAIAGFTRTQVLLGRDGRVLRPALLWSDTRAAAVAADLAARCPPDHPETAEINAWHPLARLAWLGFGEPVALREAAAVLDPKDYLNFRLTGVVASDAISLARVTAAAARGADGRSLFDVAGVDPGLAPPLREPVSIVGRVQAGLSGALRRLAGRPVATMAHDTWTGVVGLGAMRDGAAYDIAGTTEVLGIVTGAPARAEGLLTVDWGGGLWQLGGPSLAGGDSVAWFGEVLGLAPADIASRLEDLLRAPRQAAPALFLPYLRGERTPYWNPALRGAFVGLERGHGAGDLAFAVLEGVGFLNRLVLERAESATGVRAAEIRFGGGGAANPRWRQIKADILGRRVVATTSEAHGLLGAAIVARTAIGHFATLADAQDALVRPAAVHEPDPARRDFYDRLFPAFRQAEAALAPVSAALSGFSPATRRESRAI